MKSIVVSCLLILFMSSVQGTVLVVSNTHDTGVGSLRNTISNAAAFDTIRFQPSLINGGSDTVLLTSVIDITVPLTIIGLYNTSDTLIISGQDLTRIFKINVSDTASKNVWLDSLHIIQGMDTSNQGGGAIVVTSLDTLFVVNSLFASNHADSASGGAICIYRPNYPTEHSIVISNSIFRNNSALIDGGAVGFHIKNTAYSANPSYRLSFEADHSQFIGNSCDNNGGGISLLASHDWYDADSVSIYCDVDSCVILNNSAGNGGGGISLDLGNHDGTDSDISLRQTTFANNISKYGGGLFQKNVFKIQSVRLCSLLIEDCLFKLNGLDTSGTSGSGGAIYLTDMDLVGSISNSVFDSNLVKNHGGAIYVSERWTSGGKKLWVNLDISDSTIFRNNSATSSSSVSGGALVIDVDSTNLNINACRFDDNSSAGGSGAVYCSRGEAHIQSSSFDGNSAVVNGAIDMVGKLYVTNSSFTNNVSTDDVGAIRSYSMLMDASVVKNNSCSGEGGGIYYRDYLKITGKSIIHGNSAGDDGGGIYGLGTDNCILIVEDSSRIDSNSSDGNGGGVFLLIINNSSADSAIVQFENAFITHNIAQGSGGGVYVNTGDVVLCNIDSSFVQSNEAGENGGGFYIRPASNNSDISQTEVFSSSFSNNSAVNSGGGIDARTIKVNQSLFTDNAAGDYGGAIRASADTTIVVSSDFLNNEAGSNGGAMNLESLVIDACTIRGNSAELDGGGIDCVWMISDSNTITNNTAGRMGGGIYCAGLGFELGTIDSNHASLDGGGVYSTRLDIDQSSIKHNTSGRDGGGIFLVGNGVNSITNCEVIQNECVRSGGGIYAWVQSAYSTSQGQTIGIIQLDITNSSIAQNSADSNGGGIYARGYFYEENDNTDTTSAESRIFIKKSTINNNSAVHKGGGVYSCALAEYGSTYETCILRSTVNVNTSTISNNHAIYGGAICSETNELYYSGGGAVTDSRSYVNVINSTIYSNTGDSIGGIFCNGWNYSVGPVYVQSSIIANNDTADIFDAGSVNNFDFITSGGYNVFGRAPTGFASNDQIWMDTSQLQLGPLTNNGGLTETHLPQAGSVALNSGNPIDTSNAQNGIINYIRDVGAAESNLCDVYNTNYKNVCGSYYWPISDSLYFQSGTYIDSQLNSGCEAVYKIFLTVADTHAQCDTVSACEEYTWPFNGNLLQQSGLYKDTLLNSFGCDSINHLLLSIHSEYESDQNVYNCNEYMWSVNGNTYTESGTYMYSDTTIFGCDSTHRLNLTIQYIDTSITLNYPYLEANMTGAQYQWLRCDSSYSVIPGAISNQYKPANSGMYAVIVSVNGCKDTSECRYYDFLSSIIQPIGQEGVTIYPNPTNGKFIIKGNDDLNLSNCQFELFDQLGQKVTLDTDLLTPNNGEFNLSQCANGSYFLKIASSYNVWVVSIIKQ